MFVYILFLIIIFSIQVMFIYLKNNNTISLKLIKYDKLAFVVIFISLFIFSAFRDRIGVDYPNYINHIKRIQNNQYDYMEIGFKWVVLLLKGINDDHKLVFAVFSFFTLLFYLKAIWEQSNNRYISVILFLTLGFYFFTFTTVRYYFALALVFYSIKYLHNECKFKFILFIIIASLFHKSAFVCIPIYLFANQKIDNKRFLLLVLIMLSGLLLKDYLRSVMFYFYPGYENTEYDIGRFSISNFVRVFTVFIICICYRNIINRNWYTKFYSNLNSLGLVYFTGFYWTPESARIGYYMTFPIIILLPRFIGCLKNTLNRQLYKTLLFIISVTFFLVLLMNWNSNPDSLMIPYKTWLF